MSSKHISRKQQRWRLRGDYKGIYLSFILDVELVGRSIFNDFPFQTGISNKIFLDFFQNIRLYLFIKPFCIFTRHTPHISQVAANYSIKNLINRSQPSGNYWDGGRWKLLSAFREAHMCGSKHLWRRPKWMLIYKFWLCCKFVANQATPQNSF